MSDFEVLSSRVHGKGVFATRHMAVGEKVIEYVGEVITMVRPFAAIRTTAKTPTTRFTFTWTMAG